MTRPLSLLVMTWMLALGACGGDEATSSTRFDGKSEVEMFDIVQSTLCAKHVECGASATLAECQQRLDDARYYLQPISAEDRAQLDLCLDDVSAMSCNAALAETVQMPTSCATVERYLDLK